jgi:hypothetical protein
MMNILNDQNITNLSSEYQRDEKDYPDMLDKGSKPIFKLDNGKKKLPPRMKDVKPVEGGRRA